MKTKTAQPKYVELRQKSSSQLEKEQLQWDAQDNKLQLEADLLATSRDLSKQQQTLLALKSAQKLDSVEILKQQDLIRSLEAGIAALEDLIKELF